jgi:hypothetical protein
MGLLEDLNREQFELSRKRLLDMKEVHLFNHYYEQPYSCAVCGYTTTDTRKLTYGNNAEGDYPYGNGSIRCWWD